MTDDTIRLLLADDHPVVRAGLRAVLEAESDLSVVGEGVPVVIARKTTHMAGPAAMVL